MKIPSTFIPGEGLEEKIEQLALDKQPEEKISFALSAEAAGHTVEISGKEVERYKEVLVSLGYSTSLEKFTVDSRGDSPELREELGNDYLDNHVIIASESQMKDISVLPGSQGYVSSIMQQIPKGLVKSIVHYEALTGKINVLYGSKTVTGVFDHGFKDYSSSAKGLHVIISLDTLSESVKKINSLNNKIDFIKENSLRSIDNNFLEAILAEIHPLTTKYGSIESIKELKTTLDIPVDAEMLYFTHKGHGIFFFNTKEPFLVYNGEKGSKGATAFGILHSSEKSKVMDALVKNGLLNIDKESVFSALEAVAKESLKESVGDYSGLAGFQFYRVFKQFKDNPKIVEKLKKANWYVLRDASYGNIDFGSLPLDIKERITKPRDEAVGSYLKVLNEKAFGE